MYNRNLKKGILLYTILSSISLTTLSAKTFVIDHIYETDSTIRQNQINHGVILDADLNVCHDKMYIFHGGSDHQSCSTPGIPTLSSFLKTLTNNNAIVSLDVKSATDANYRNTINEIKSLGLDESRFIFWVRSLSQAKNVRKYSQKVKLAYSIEVNRYANVSKLASTLRTLEANNNYNIFMIGTYGNYGTYSDYADYIHNKLGLKVAFQIQGPNQHTQTYLNISQKADFIISDNPIDYMDSYPNYFKPYYSSSTPIVKQNATVKQEVITPKATQRETRKLEAEDNFTIINDSGSRNIQLYTGDKASQGKFVSLYDTDDELSFNFTIDKDGEHTLKFRVRSGSENNHIGRLNGYEIKIDGNIETSFTENINSFEIDKTTGSSWCWGTIQTTIPLSAGKHKISIKATMDWNAVDYFSVPSALTSNIEAEDALYEKIDDVGNYQITKHSISNASEGKFVTLYDIGDSARFKLHVQDEGLYTIGIRIRSGSPLHRGIDYPPLNNTNMHNGAYSIKVNGEIEDFNGDDNSISTLKDWIYWGTLNSTHQVYLNAGDNFIDIKANQRWLAVDSFTLEK